MSSLYSLISSSCIWLSSVTFLWSLERSNIIEEMSNYLTLFFNIKELNINQACASQLSQLKLSQNAEHSAIGSFNSWIHYQLLPNVFISLMFYILKVNTDLKFILDSSSLNTNWQSPGKCLFQKWCLFNYCC